MLRALRLYLIASILPLLFGLDLARGQNVFPTATLTVNGAETQPGGTWDHGNIQVDFNGFLEIVNYGQYSTNASLASALAAMFVHDYHSFGLYAKAAVNSAQQNVVTFQLVDGSGFGPLNVVDPSASFSLAGSGFAASSATTADIGVATLTINGTTVAMSNYGSGSTAASIAQDLSSQAASNSANNVPVAVTSEGPNLYLQVKQPTGSYSDSYSLSFSTGQSFSTSTPASGTLTGSTDVAPITVYSYSIANPSGGSGYAANGNVNYLNDSVMGNWSYNYDNLNRLTSGTASGGAYNGNSTCWSYDSFGNRTNQIVSNAPFTTANGTLCQPASGATNLASPATYQAADNHMTTTPQLPNGLPGATGTWPNNGIYDAAGNVINDGVNQYTYDAEGRVCALNGPQGMIGYQYDADGNRVGKGTVTTIATCDIAANGYQPMTDFVLDQSGGQITEMAVYKTSAGTQYQHVHSNVTADGALIASFDSLYSLHFYLTDALGTRRAQTDSAGIPEQTCQSLPFGDQLYCTSGSLSNPTEHHFTNQIHDAESGLDFFAARYYGSSIGRFQSPDDGSDQNETDPQSWNLYSYGRNSPLTSIDPDGHNYWICANGSPYCYSISDAQWNSDRAQIAAGKSGGITYQTTDSLGSALLLCNGSPCGSATYYEEGMHDATLPIILGIATGGVANSIVRGGVNFVEDIAERHPNDIARQNNNPAPPSANAGSGRIGTNPNQAAELQRDLAQIRAEGARDIRVNQEQVNAQGTRVGQNRPDLQYTDSDGTRHYIEYDQNPASGVDHAQRIRANDPTGVVTLKTIK